MSDPGDGTVAVGIGETQILAGRTPPDFLGVFQQHADLTENFPGLEDSPLDGYFFVAVNDGGEWPRLVVTQQYAPSGPGFDPGVLFVPETRQLFIVAGTRLSA